MADAVTTSTVLANDIVTEWIARKMYRTAERHLALNAYAEKYTLPERMGTKLRAVRVDRLGQLPRKPLTQGVPPDSVAMAVSKQEVTVEQWGLVVLLTDVAELVASHPMLEKAIDRSALAMAEMFERETAEMLLAGTAVVYGGDATTRASLDGDKFSTSTGLTALARLRTLGAAPIKGDLFGGVLPPNIEADLLDADTIFRTGAADKALEKFEFGRIGIWCGVDWRRGNFLPIFEGVGAPGTQTAKVAGYGSEAGAGAGIGGSKITVIAKDAENYYERRISQEKSVTAGKDSAVVTTPTSAKYVYDIYMTDTAGANYKLLFQDVAENTAKTVDSAAYTAGSAATPTGAPASGKEVFIGWVFGKDAFGRVELNGMSLRSYLTPPGASYSDPLAQGRKAGQKVMWKSFILDNDYMVRFEANSAFSALLPA